LTAPRRIRANPAPSVAVLLLACLIAVLSILTAAPSYATGSNTAHGLAVGTNSTVNDTADGLNHDARIVALTGGYDANGNVTNDGTRTFTYDLGNRLTGVSLSGTAVALAYDPVGSTPTTTRYLYDGPRLVAEYDGTGTIVLRRYAHGPSDDNPLIEFDGTGVASTNASYYLEDRQGSIVATANASGALTANQTYDAYGVPSQWAGTRFRYTGQIVLPEAQLYYYKARVYDPISGRFLQTDPVGYKDDLDLYAYVGDDPVNGVDPTGDDRIELFSRTVTVPGTNIPTPYGHLYVVITDTKTGAQTFYRAGPKTAPGSPIFAQKGAYVDGSIDKLPSSQLVQTLKNDASPAGPDLKTADAFQAKVNSLDLTYKTFSQNSNSYAEQLGEDLTGKPRRPSEQNTPAQGSAFAGCSQGRRISTPLGLRSASIRSARRQCSRSDRAWLFLWRSRNPSTIE
jgi:RHS repeat-associated protein